MFGLSINKVTGNSMFPVLPANSYVLFATWFRRKKLKPKHIVRVQHPSYGQIIKQVKSIDENGFIWLEGCSTESVSSEQMGAISLQQINGLAIYTVK